MVLDHYTDVLVFELVKSCFPGPEVKFMAMEGGTWTLWVNFWA